MTERLTEEEIRENTRQFLANCAEIDANTTPGPMRYGEGSREDGTVPHTKEECAEYMRERILASAGDNLYFVAPPDEDGVSVFVACTGNGKASRANAEKIAFMWNNWDHLLSHIRALSPKCEGRPDVEGILELKGCVIYEEVTGLAHYTLSLESDLAEARKDLALAEHHYVAQALELIDGAARSLAAGKRFREWVHRTTVKAQEDYAIAESAHAPDGEEGKGR
jgi:hypothetical protein